MTANLSRRAFLAATGALTVSFATQVQAQSAHAAPQLPGSLKDTPRLTGWVQVAPDGTVTVFTGKVELGQGIRTALIQVAAEQLCLTPGQITLVTADTGRTADEGYTAGSHSMQDSGPAIMNAAAEVRGILVAEAAARREQPEPKSFAAIWAIGGVAPELAYVTAKFAALVPFARVADLLSELLPTSGAANAGTERNRTMRAGETLARLTPPGAAALEPDAVTPAVIVGLDGGYVRSRHRRPERNFEVIAGKVIDASGTQHRFAFARNGGCAGDFACALIRAGVRVGTPSTVLSDGDAGLWALQRAVLPSATVVLDWFHIAMRFEHVLRAGASVCTGTVDAHLGTLCRRDIERAKWCPWHGRWKRSLVKLVTTYRWTETKSIRGAAGIETLRRHLRDLIDYLEANQATLVDYGARRRRGEPISTAFVESAVNEIVSRRMIKKQQMRWNRWTVQPFLDVRTAVLNGTLEGAFRQRYPKFRPANRNIEARAAA